ncbi:MAG: LVIVD repeat-containing protein, partial [Candidatus Hodarchaeales archaeon]
MKKNRIRVFSIVILFCLVCFSVKTLDFVTATTAIPIVTPSLVGQYNTGGFSTDINVSGDHAYIADMLNGLVIIDISTPSNPQEIGNYQLRDWLIPQPPPNPPIPLSGSAECVAFSDYVFLGDSYGLVILDVTIPASPTEVGVCRVYDFTEGVDVENGHAFFASYSGLTIVSYDPNNPSSPSVVGFLATTGDAYDVDVINDYAYIADGSNGLVIIDISTPSNPQVIGQIGTTNALGVFINGSSAYIADGQDGLAIIDISNPQNPSIVGRYTTSGVTQNVFVKGKYAILADSNVGVDIVDVV